MKKNLFIAVNKKTLNEFKGLAIDYYYTQDKFKRANFTAFFEMQVNTLTEKYKALNQLKKPSNKNLESFFKGGKRPYTSNLYNHMNIESLYLSINSEIYEKYLTLMWSYYYNNLKADTDIEYTSTFFFYDFVEEIKKLK